MDVQCYGQRLLNPFRGSMHVIRCAAAEAVTADGVHWDIYVTNDQLLDGLTPTLNAQVSEIRYGSWSESAGLKRGAIRTSTDFDRMEAMGDAVYAALLERHLDVPFPFRDCYELWLLDESGRPLALLHSVTDDADLIFDLAAEWHAGYAARDRFKSAGLPPGAGNAGDYLTHYINARAGTTPTAQWFRRAPDGRGEGLAGIGLDPARVDRRLAASEFPSLFVSASGADELHRRLIEDFIDWQAAWFLVLPDLEPELRRHLETHAHRQAHVVEALHRLYPEILDTGAIKAARVEAVLRRAQAAPPGPGEDPLSPYYIELNPCGSE